MAIKFLIVDDDIETHKSLSLRLTQLGKSLSEETGTPGTNVAVEVFHAKSLAEAERLTLQEQPDVTFLELLHVTDSIADCIASIRRFKPPVIIHTSIIPNAILPGTDTAIYVACIAAGAEDYFVKGTDDFRRFKLATLRAAIKNYNLQHPTEGHANLKG